MSEDDCSLEQAPRGSPTWCVLFQHEPKMIPPNLNLCWQHLETKKSLSLWEPSTNKWFSHVLNCLFYHGTNYSTTSQTTETVFTLYNPEPTINAYPNPTSTPYFSKLPALIPHRCSCHPSIWYHTFAAQSHCTMDCVFQFYFVWLHRHGWNPKFLFCYFLNAKKKKTEQLQFNSSGFFFPHVLDSQTDFIIQYNIILLHFPGTET